MNAYGNTTSLGASAETPRPLGMIEGIDNELSVSLKMIHELNAQAKNLCERLFGAQPEAVNGKGNPTGPAQAGKLEATTGYIRESIQELRAHLSRLERL